MKVQGLNPLVGMQSPLEGGGEEREGGFSLFFFVPLVTSNVDQRLMERVARALLHMCGQRGTWSPLPLRFWWIPKLISILCFWVSVVFSLKERNPSPNFPLFSFFFNKKGNFTHPDEINHIKHPHLQNWQTPKQYLLNQIILEKQIQKHFWRFRNTWQPMWDSRHRWLIESCRTSKNQSEIWTLWTPQQPSP